MGIKAKCGGVQFIRVRVVLCPNHVCSSNKKKEVKKNEDKHIIVKNMC